MDEQGIRRHGETVLDRAERVREPAYTPLDINGNVKVMGQIGCLHHPWRTLVGRSVKSETNVGGFCAAGVLRQKFSRWGVQVGSESSSREMHRRDEGKGGILRCRMVDSNSETSEGGSGDPEPG